MYGPCVMMVTNKSWTDDGHVPSEQEELTATGVSPPALSLVDHEQDGLLIGWL